MDTLEEEDELINQPLLSGPSQPSANGSANASKDLHELATDISQKTEIALSAVKQSPQDGLALLEGIAKLSKQMVGEAQEDVELFSRAGRANSS